MKKNIQTIVASSFFFLFLGGILSISVFAADDEWSIGNDFMTMKKNEEGNNVYVGIGTTTPTQKLDVAGNVKATGFCIGVDCKTTWTDVVTAGGGGSKWADATGGINYTGGKVGIGTSSPTGKLEISSDASINNQFIGLSNTEAGNVRRWMLGMITGSSGKLRIYDATAGADRMVFTANGNVGIGTTNPQQSLHVSGVSTSAQIVLERTGTSLGKMAIGADDGGFVVMDGDYTRRLTVSTIGNVGIGINSPSAKLHSISTTAGTLAGKFVGTTNTWTSEIEGGAISGTSYGQLITAGSTSADMALFIRSAFASPLFLVRGDGNVGIGTTTPGGKIDVVENGFNRLNLFGGHNFSFSQNNNHWGVNYYFDGVWKVMDTARPSTMYQSDSSTGAFVWNSQASGTYSPTLKMTLTNAGNLGIGITTPDATLDVARGSGPNGTALFRGTTRSSHFNFSTDENTYIRGGKANSHVFLNDNGGNVGVGTTSPSEKLEVAGKAKATAFLQSSDRSLKTNISPIFNAKNILMLSGVSFNWKNSGEKDLGFIAQEVEKFFPELVATGSDGLKSVKYGNITAILLEVVKSQNTEIQNANAKISNLEKQNAEILKRLEALEK